MSIGMKRGTVYLEPHQKEWERASEETIQTLKNILGSTVIDIQHIGSTSIKNISAKPIIDIAVAVNNFDDILSKRDELERNGIIYRFEESPKQLLFVMGDFENDIRSHHIHVVIYGSDEWNNYINFRDYLNSNIEAAREYESVKLRLAEQYPNDRIAYTDGKQEVIDKLLDEARLWRIESSKEFHFAVLSHQEPICPICGKGRIICSQGKIIKPHYFECTNHCGWYMNIDYNDCLVE